MNRAELLQIAKPILFNTEMVRAILGGRKTVTRRAVKQKYDNADFKMKTDKYGTRLVEIQNDIPLNKSYIDCDGAKHTKRHMRAYAECKPKYHKNDILYVRGNMDGIM